MNKNTNFTYLLRSALVLVLLLGLLSPNWGQGWNAGFFAGGSSQIENTRNDVIHIPAYVDSISFPVCLAPNDSTNYFLFSRLVDEDFTGFATINHSIGNPEPNNRTHIPKSSVMLSGDSIVVLFDKINIITGEQDLYLSCYEMNGIFNIPTQLVWQQAVYESTSTLATGAALQRTLDGQLISLGAIKTEGLNNTHDLLLTKSDLNGQVIWSKTYPSVGDDLGVQVQVASDGGYWLLKNVQVDLNSPETSIWLIKTDANGTIEWEKELGQNDIAYDMILTQEGTLAMTGHKINGDLFVLKTDEIGQIIWRQDYPTPSRSMFGHGIIEDKQQHIVVAGTLIEDNDDYTNPFIAKLSKNGTPLWEKRYGKRNINDAFNDIELTPAGDYVMGGYNELEENPSIVGGYFIKTDTFGTVKGGLVHGNIFQDFNIDCSATEEELDLENWNVQVVNDSLNFYGNTDAEGNYYIPVDVRIGNPMDYVVSVVPPSEYWESCDNDIAITLPYLDTMQVDFPMQALVNCPFMTAQLGNTSFRPCESATVYVNYCNDGTAIAENATVDITLDEALTFDNATITPSQIDGQTYTFPLGNVDINECGSFEIELSVACEGLELGDVLCLEAHLTPDDLCEVPGLLWSGALLQLTYTCDTDSIHYQIENVGTNGMGAELEYVIIEDAVLLREGTFDLDPTQVKQTDALPLNETVYHLFAQQEPGAPGPDWLSLSTMGCPLDNSPTFNEFPQYSGDPFTIIFCPEVVGPFDPNDKQAIPTGFGDDNNILPNTDLDYTIRFQNTGTDTAFRVVIVDTLTTHLDPATVVPGPSSHPYDFRLNGEGVLSFIFNNIALPDSNVNVAASQGFVSFKVAQRQNLAIGTRIENRAGIYFDFNEPIITNTAFHTVKTLINIVSGSVNVATPKLQVKVMPNPMKNGAWIRLEGQEEQGLVTLRLFDVSGRMVKQVHGMENEIWLERSDLMSGMYFFNMEKEGIWQASGKIIVQ